MLDLLAEHWQVGLVVLAPYYLRILTPWFVGAYQRCTTEVRRSFLPAFFGANPYRRSAYPRNTGNRHALAACLPTARQTLTTGLGALLGGAVPSQGRLVVSEPRERERSGAGGGPRRSLVVRFPLLAALWLLAGPGL